MTVPTLAISDNGIHPYDSNGMAPLTLCSIQHLNNNAISSTFSRYHWLNHLLIKDHIFEQPIWSDNIFKTVRFPTKYLTTTILENEQMQRKTRIVEFVFVLGPCTHLLTYFIQCSSGKWAGAEERQIVLLWCFSAICSPSQHIFQCWPRSDDRSEWDLKCFLELVNSFEFLGHAFVWAIKGGYNYMLLTDKASLRPKVSQSTDQKAKPGKLPLSGESFVKPRKLSLQEKVDLGWKLYRGNFRWENWQTF